MDFVLRRQAALDVCGNFPAAAVGGEDNVWLASTAFVGGHRVLRLHSLNPDGGDVLRDLVVPGATGVGAPAVCGMGAGCATVCPVEQEGRWRIACFFPGTGAPVFHDAGWVNEMRGTELAALTVRLPNPGACALISYRLLP